MSTASDFGYMLHAVVELRIKSITINLDKEEKQMMHELDVVRLTEDFNGLPTGTEGTIVLKYNEEFFEVEFFDVQGNTLDVLTTPRKILELKTSI